MIVFLSTIDISILVEWGQRFPFVMRNAPVHVDVVVLLQVDEDVVRLVPVGFLEELRKAQTLSTAFGLFPSDTLSQRVWRNL